MRRVQRDHMRRQPGVKTVIVDQTRNPLPAMGIQPLAGNKNAGVAGRQIFAVATKRPENLGTSRHAHLG